ncbi:MAG: hypothetical protein CSA19_00050, partial [Deltaproteobacteria bacterium]
FIFFIIKNIISFTIFYFNPEREPEEEDELSVIAPIDGKIEAIDTQDEKLRIHISSFITDNHLIRSPIFANLHIVKKAGINLFAKNPQSQRLNASLNLYFKSAHREFALLLTEGFLRSKLRLLAKNGEKIKLAKRVAFFNAQKSIFICPKDTQLKVCVGDNIRSGETLIGFMPNE